MMVGRVILRVMVSYYHHHVASNFFSSSNFANFLANFFEIFMLAFNTELSEMPFPQSWITVARASKGSLD